MKVWVEIAKDKNKPCYVFQYKPITRGYDFCYENDPLGGILILDSNTDINKYLNDYTLFQQYVEVSESSFLYEVEL